MPENRPSFAPRRSARALLVLLPLLGAPLAGRAAADLNGVNAYPNPARAYAGQSTVTFDNLTRPATLRILDAGGALVLEVRVDDPAFRYVWDLKNDAGTPVASGVYLYRLTSPAGHKKTGKLAVIR